MKLSKVNKFFLLILVLSFLLCSNIFVVQGATVKISSKKISAYVGQKKTLKIEGTNKKIKWSSSNKKVVTVNKKGVVKAKKAGKAKIYAKVGKKQYTCKVTVNNAVEVNKTSVKFDELYQEKAVLFTSHLYGSLTFNIQDTDVVSCRWSKWKKEDIKLFIKAKKNGITKVTVTNSFNKEQTVITVIVDEPTIEDIEAEQAAKLTVKIENQLPKEFANYRYNGTVEQLYMLEEVKCQVTYSLSLDEYSVKMYFSGEKTYDYNGANQSDSVKISWKLYKDDYVVDSGTCYTASVLQGEKFKDASSSVYELKEDGEYVLKILNTN